MDFKRSIFETKIAPVRVRFAIQTEGGSDVSRCQPFRTASLDLQAKGKFSTVSVISDRSFRNTLKLRSSFLVPGDRPLIHRKHPGTAVRKTQEDYTGSTYNRVPAFLLPGATDHAKDTAPLAQTLVRPCR